MRVTRIAPNANQLDNKLSSSNEMYWNICISHYISHCFMLPSDVYMDSTSSDELIYIACGATCTREDTRKWPNGQVRRGASRVNGGMDERNLGRDEKKEKRKLFSSYLLVSPQSLITRLNPSPRLLIREKSIQSLNCLIRTPFVAFEPSEIKCSYSLATTSFLLVCKQCPTFLAL